MIDNIEIIKPILKRENEDDFYYIQIIQRKKDIDGFKGKNRSIKDYYICSEQQLDKRYDEIKELCKHFNARAYIRLSRRNSESIARDMIVAIGESFKNKSYKHLRKIYSTVVGKSLGLDKLWIIDIDGGNVVDKTGEDFLWGLKPEGNKILATIPTKNGIHIITKPFDLQTFKIGFPDIDVHKNNPTILFIP